MEPSNHSHDKDEEIFDIKKIVINPEISAISNEVSIIVNFQVRRPIRQIKWKVNYILDSTGKRHILELLETEAAQDYTDSSALHTIKLQTPKIEVEEVPRKTLLNVGLLHLQAFEKESKDVQLNINMVVHVGKDKADETKLSKTVLNPLE